MILYYAFRNIIIRTIKTKINRKNIQIRPIKFVTNSKFWLLKLRNKIPSICTTLLVINNFVLTKNTKNIGLLNNQDNY